MSWPTSLFDWSALRFVLVGAANTLIGLLTIYAAKWLLGMGDVVANAVGYAIGLAVSFQMHARFTFRYTGPQLAALVKYVLVIVASYLLNLTTVMTAIHGLHINSYLAQAMGIVPYTLCMYLCSRHFVFVQSDALPEAQPRP